MSSPGSKRTFEATLEPSEYPATQPATAPIAPSAAGEHDHEASSRASTPLSSVPDHVSTRPSSPPSGMKEQPQPMEAPAKKRKLTFAEKESIQIEKDIRAQQKVDEKARKDAEKEVKKEEKRAKAEEQEQKKRERDVEREEKRKQQEEAKEEKRKAKDAKDAAKEAETSAKEAEREAKEKEKAKKERSQMRLNAFFVKQPGKAPSATSSRRSSIASLKDSSPAKPKPQATDLLEDVEEISSVYDKMFPAFFRHAHTDLAPVIRYESDPQSLAHSCTQIEQGIRNPSAEINPAGALKRALDDSSHEPFSKRRRLGRSIFPVRDLVAKISGTSTAPIDLTCSNDAARDALQELSAVPMKYLRYAEDVRPPYIGTYTRFPGDKQISRLCRDPFARGLPEVDYDYDSEAEWEEPEEGEDLNSDDDEEEADDDDGDLDGFLDDEDESDGVPKRRNLMGDMEPVTTPLFWQSGPVRRCGAAGVPYGAATIDLSRFRISPLLVDATGPIDPFSTKYWAPPAPVPAAQATESSCMAPPPAPQRVPLNTLHGPNNPPTAANALAAIGAKAAPGAAPVTGSAKPKAAAKPFPPELLPDFKREIEGSDLSKIGLVEVLKKKFPQVTGKTVGETLPLVARREGKTVADKKWVLI